MKNFISIVLLFSTFLLTNDIKAQQVLINEVMSSNASTIADEDGEYSDWIELYNTQDSTINLNGYGISDDQLSPFKWLLPQLSLAAKDHLLIFASSKNKTELVRYWETIIDWGDVWKYRLGTSEPSSNWNSLGFDDQLWLSGKSGFGYGDNDDSTIVPYVQSMYVRKNFNVDDVNKISMTVLHVDFDDGFVAYLNGVEIARENIGTINVPPAFDESASSYTEPLIVYGGKPHSYVIQNFQTLLHTGKNVLAIQVHNYGTGSSDLTLIPFLSLGMNSVPVNPKGADPLLDLPNKFLHTNFKLSSNGETLVVTNPQGSTVDQISFTTIGSDMSYGRQPDGSSSWFLFSDPTPGESNTTQGYNGVTADPQFSLVSGFYPSAQAITLISGSINDNIHFTLDGSEPTDTSQIYITPIQINSTTVLRTKAFSTGMLPSKTITNTYFINFATQLPVISLSTNPANFFDEETGIYTYGDSAETSFPYFGANFWKDWEKPVHVEYFENNGIGNGFSIDAGVQIFGGWSRGNAQKSLAIYARGKYGYSSINYKLFDDLPFTKYQSFVLRNAGNDWSYTMFRDGLMTSLVDGVDIDKQDFKPAVLFINGEYWGIQNMREKVNENFLAQHHNVNPDSVDILELDAQVVQGDSSDYLDLYSFIENNSLAVHENYEYVKTKMEVDNFIRYFVSEIYFANTDWPGSNIKYWRKSVTGKWRWILFDTDFGFGLFEPNAYKHNTLEFATALNGPNWPNPSWSTLMLRKLLENPSFKNDFINCFADYSNTIFKAQEVNKIITEIKSLIESEMPRHIQRWNQFDFNTWSNNVQGLRNFANQRITNLQLNFIQKFGLAGLAAVNLSISDTAMGSIKINSLEIKSLTWMGSYFFGVPISVIAQPKKGFRFVKWEGGNTSSEDSLTLELNSTINLNAVFEMDKNYSVPKIVINEINYNSSVTFNPQDWIEFYNNSDTSVNISNWIFRDSENIHNYIIPEGTVLSARNYIVLCSDDTLFHPLFPDVQNYLGNFNFGLSGGGELLMLLDNNLNLIDSLTYDDQAPWPAEADGNGPTLSLKNPDLDNSIYQSWSISLGYGTPGKINDIFTNINDENNNILPKGYYLEQNYPNPFNPVTKIRYQIPTPPISSPLAKGRTEEGFVSLKVYDILGNEVATLVNEFKKPGFYEVEFNGNNLSSGVYFYRIQADIFISTKKLILLK